MNMTRLYNFLYQPMDIAGLAIVRVLFGVIILLESTRYMDIMRLISKYTQADFNFKFRFFEWVEPLSTFGMFWVFVAYALSGIFIILGIFYHVSTIIAFLVISYLFLIDATNYLNHFYLIIIFSAMMIFIPAHKGWSLYAYLKPQKSSQTVDAWAIWLIRLQIFIVYFHAAIAKMNVDWINGMPLFEWIGEKATPTGIESLLAWPMVIYAFTYVGLFYDLIVGPMLLFKKTRAEAYCLSLCFHLLNFYLFNIGVFPWFMLAATTIFFETSWPRSFLNMFFEHKFLPLEISAYEHNQAINLVFWQKSFVALMIIHLSFQALWPLRHFAYEGYVAWNEEGHNFAWHMKLRGKTGKITFSVRDPKTGKQEVINMQDYITKRQEIKMLSRPYLVMQFAHLLRDKYTYKNEEPAEVYAESKIKINGRDAQRLYDPAINLSNITVKTPASEWVLPIRQPVWNAKHKKNRFGDAFKKDEIALKAIPKLSYEK